LNSLSVVEQRQTDGVLRLRIMRPPMGGPHTNEMSMTCMLPFFQTEKNPRLFQTNMQQRKRTKFVDRDSNIVFFSINRILIRSVRGLKAIVN